MALFGKKKEKTGTPVDQVTTMRSQGIDNNRIIQTLQRDGYSSAQIFEAMNMADRSLGINGSNSDASQAMAPQGQQPVPPTQAPASEQQTPASQPDHPVPDFAHESFKQSREAPQSFPPYQESAPDVEELVESVIDEKWNDLVKDINKIIEWKNQADSKIDVIEKDFSNLKGEFDKLHQAVIGKIGEYDKNILNVGAEVKAMERVFSKVLPVFTENVSELSRVTEILKKPKTSSKSK